jgi:macrolide transport system ATP-binding/permease protein
MLDSAIQDLRVAIRQLAKNKGFTLTAVLTVALAIGANTAIFTLMHAVMFQSLPVSDPSRLYRLGDGDNCCVIGGIQTRFSMYSYPLYLYFRDHAPEFVEMAAFQGGPGRVGVHRDGVATPSVAFVDQFVSGNYFSMFGVKPFAGRLLTAADDRRGVPPVAVMSYRAWAQYGSDPSVIGSTFIIDGAPFTITGIASPGFFGDTLRPDPPDFWMPLATEHLVHGQRALLDHADTYWLYAIGRLKPGTAVGPLESKLNVQLKQWLLQNDPPTTSFAKREFERQYLALTPAGSGINKMKQNFGSDLKLLMSITGLVLLIACANLANLQLARGIANRAQASIRVALGAPRSRLVRQTLTESVALAVLGGGAGLLVAMLGTEVLVKLAFGGAKFVPINTNPSIPVLCFSFLLSLATGIVFGIAPAWSASRADPANALRGLGRSTAHHTTWTQKMLVATQVAVSLVLLTSAGLMVQTLRNLENQQFGFQPEGKMVVNVNAAFSGYSPEKLAAVYREAEHRMELIPGVQSASLSLYSPMEGNNWSMGISIEERPPDPNQPFSSSWDRVTPRFFETIGARILRGRMFDQRDSPNATHVAVVNQAFADKFFPNQDPLGKRFGLGGQQHRADYEIAGVVESVRFRNPRLPTPPMFFLPLLQMWTNEWNNPTLARSNLIGNMELRVTGRPASFATQIQRALGDIDPNLTVLNVTTIPEQLRQQLGHEHLIARLMELFGVAALLLASVGLYGVTAHSVARRTSEIGIRMALGATRATVVRMILHTVLTQIGVGMLIGLPLALGVGRLLADQLYGVNSADPFILIAVVFTLGFAALVAGFRPAWIASSTDPVQALRTE